LAPTLAPSAAPSAAPTKVPTAAPTAAPTETPPLCGAAYFGVLGATEVSNTGSTVVTGSVGSSPTPTISGFPPGTATGTIHVTNDATVIAAQSAALSTYNCLSTQVCDSDLSGQDLGGLVLGPGVYCFTASAQLTGTLTINDSGPTTFIIGTTLTTASSSSVVGNATIYWAVGSSATIGTSTDFRGAIYASVSVTATTSATFTGQGGLFALNGAITLDTNTVE
jgi:type VI secretion system secreted protein VgrG